MNNSKKDDAPQNPKKRKTGIYVDVNKVIESRNEKNPDLKKMTQKSLAEEMETSEITVMTMKKGNASVAFKQALLMSEISGLEVKDFIIVGEREENK